MQIGTAVAVCVPITYTIAALSIASSGKSSSIAGTAYIIEAFQGPIAVISGITIIFGLVALLAVFCGMQNLLGLCAWAYTAVAHWALVCACIVVFSSIATYGLSFAATLLAWIAPPAFVWLFAAGIMDAHRRVVTEAIAQAALAVAAPPAGGAAADAGGAAAPGSGGASRDDDDATRAAARAAFAQPAP